MSSWSGMEFMPSIDNEESRDALASEIGSLSLELAGDSGESDMSGFLKRLEEYILSDEGLSESLLYRHQQGVFYDIHEFLDEGKSRGYIKMPTGSGKTAVFSTLVNALSAPRGKSDFKARSLVLVPKLDIVDQTVGINGKRGFAQFSNGLKVSTYDGRIKDLSGDTVVMTYSSLTSALRKGDIGPSTFPLVICDEAHNTLGPATKKAVEEVSYNSLLVGLTATPRYLHRSITEIFPDQIHNLELREAIEAGILSPLQCFAIKSDAKIHTLNPRSDFTEGELRHLIKNEWRNGKAIEFTKSLIENGKQGLIACVPGENVKHAKEMAERLSREFIFDKTGTLRRVKAVCVSGETADRQSVYEAYESGRIDVLTYVDLLTEGWDSEKAKFLVNMRPTTSPVDAVQRIGRVLRPTEDGQIATVIEFLDDSDKPIYTAFHELGEEVIEQGRIFGINRPEVADEAPDVSEYDIAQPQPPLELPEDILLSLSLIDHIEISRLVINPISRAPEGYLSFVAFGKANGVGYNTIASIVEELQLDTLKANFYGTVTDALSPDQQELILAHEYFDIQAAAEGYLSVNVFAQANGLNRKTVMKIIKQLGLELGKAKVGARRNKIAEILSPEQQVLLLQQEIFQYTDPEGGYKSLQAFAAEIGVDPKKLNGIVDELQLELRKFRFGGVIAKALSPEQQELVMLHEYFDIQPPPEGYISIKKFAEAHNVTPVKLGALARETGMALLKAKTKGKETFFLSPEQQTQILNSEYFTIQAAQEGYVSLSAFAADLGTDITAVRKVVEELLIKPCLAKFHTKIAEGLSPEEQKSVLEHPFFKVGPIPEGYVSLNSFIKSFGSATKVRQEIQAVIRDLGLSLEKGKSMGRAVDILSAEQQELIRAERKHRKTAR